MKAVSFFAYKCPKCNTKITAGGIVGTTEIRCPSCRTLMVPDEDGQPSAANVRCPNCGSQFGLVTSDKCPICGSAFTRI